MRCVICGFEQRPKDVMVIEFDKPLLPYDAEKLEDLLRDVLIEERLNGSIEDGITGNSTRFEGR